jgi:hypothetical protein
MKLPRTVKPEVFGRKQPYYFFLGRGRATNLGRCNIFMKEVQPLRDKHDKLKIKERALFFTGELIITTIGVAVRS